jgi:hypothetical protein
MQNKFEIIETPDYILAVSDEEIKFKDYITDKYKVWQWKDNSSLLGRNKKKIIAYQPKGNAPELDLPLLPEMIIEDDVEKLAKNSMSLCESNMGYLNTWVRGYKAATKIFSEDDLNGYLSFIEDNYHYHSDAWHNADTDEPVKRKDMLSAYIQSLKQHKAPKYFIAEMEEVAKPMPNIHIKTWELKTTTINGKTYLVGTYLYD